MLCRVGSSSQWTLIWLHISYHRVHSCCEPGAKKWSLAAVELAALVARELITEVRIIFFSRILQGPKDWFQCWFFVPASWPAILTLVQYLVMWPSRSSSFLLFITEGSYRTTGFFLRSTELSETIMNLWQPLSIPRVPAKGSVLRCTLVTSNQVTVLGNLTDPLTVKDVQLWNAWCNTGAHGWRSNSKAGLYVAFARSILRLKWLWSGSCNRSIGSVSA